MISLKNIFGKKEVMTPEEEAALIERYASNVENSEEFKQAAEEAVNEFLNLKTNEDTTALDNPIGVHDTPVSEAAPEFVEDVDPEYLFNDPRVVGWLSVEEQEALFSGLLLFYNPSKHTILDVGCGRADLYGYIKNLFQLDTYDLYTGMDMNPNILDIGSKKYPDVNLISMDILNDNVDDTFDWVVGSGLFNLNDHPDMEDYSRRVIDKMLSKATVGVAVNMLIGIPEDLSDEDKAQLVVHNPATWLDYLINKYNRVICRHDYMSGDVTFIIFK